MHKKWIFLTAILFAAAMAAAQTNSYKQTNLVSDGSVSAAHTDNKLINPWGIALLPGQPFWVADNNSGFATLYDQEGNKAQPTVQIPAPPGDMNPATPTGMVANGDGGFVVQNVPSQFIFDTEDGTISGWNGTGNAILAVDNSAAGAVYKGLALVNNGTGNFLLATNFHSGKVEVYDDHFRTAALAGSFADPDLPAGFAPFGIQVLGNRVLVSYAMQDAAKHDPVNGVGNGFVNLFDDNGNLLERFASNGTLNSPWGMAMTPANFGAFSNALLIGNFGDGLINAYDPSSKNFLGQLKDTNGTLIANASLWAMVFGSAGTGDPSTLYFTAGLANEQHGLFGTLAASAPAGPDFSLMPSASMATVTAGGSTRITIVVAPLGGFAQTVSFGCSAPAGISCSFSPQTVEPSVQSATTTLTLTSSASGPHYGPMGLWLGLSGLGLFGTVLTGVARRKRTATLLLSSLAVVVLLGSALFAVGCGYNNMSGRGTAMVTVTGTSGSDVHSTIIQLTVQ